MKAFSSNYGMLEKHLLNYGKQGKYSANYGIQDKHFVNYGSDISYEKLRAKWMQTSRAEYGVRKLASVVSRSKVSLDELKSWLTTAEGARDVSLN